METDQKSTAPWAPVFRPGDRVIVVAEHHKDHGRRGIVVSVDLGQDWPVSVLLGHGISSVIHKFREDELLLDFDAEREQALAAADSPECVTWSQADRRKTPPALAELLVGCAA